MKYEITRKKDASIDKCNILSMIKETYKLKSRYTEDEFIYIPMKLNRSIPDIFIPAKSKNQNQKPSNKNVNVFTYSSGKKQLTAMYRLKSRYFNAIKFIVFVYNKNIPDYQKTRILRKYVNDVQNLPMNKNNTEGLLQRALFVKELTAEIDNIEQTKTVSIAY